MRNFHFYAVETSLDCISRAGRKSFYGFVNILGVHGLGVEVA